MRRMRRVSRNHSAEYGPVAYSALRVLNLTARHHVVIDLLGQPYQQLYS